jgi:hypothetical protein
MKFAIQGASEGYTPPMVAYSGSKANVRRHVAVEWYHPAFCVSIFTLKSSMSAPVQTNATNSGCFGGVTGRETNSTSSSKIVCRLRFTTHSNFIFLQRTHVVCPSSKSHRIFCFLHAEQARTFREMVGILAIRPWASVNTEGTGGRGFGIGGGEFERRFRPYDGEMSQEGGEPLTEEVADPFASS